MTFRDLFPTLIPDVLEKSEQA